MLVLTSAGNYKGQRRNETSVTIFCKRSVATQLEGEGQEHGVKENTGSNPSCVTMGSCFASLSLSFIALNGNNTHLRGYGEDYMQ